MSEDKSKNNNINITSYNQMGGITAQTVNFGTTARYMNENLGAQLQEHIPTDANVRVVAVLGDSEAFGFANQVMTWMKNNGYENIQGVDQAVYSQPVKGQNVNKKDENEFEIIIGSRN